MNEQDIKKTIFQLLKNIAPETDPSQLKADENIREALNIDSFDALQFIVALDKSLGIEIPEEDYGKTATLKNLICYLQQKINR